MMEEIGNYVDHQVTGASPAQLIDMLFDRACRDLKGAKELFSLAGDPRSAADAIHLIVHAQQIIAELHSSLNMKEGGELARNLSRLYEYMQFRLVEAVNQRKPEGVAEVSGLLAEIHGAWHSITVENQTLESRALRVKAGAGILVA